MMKRLFASSLFALSFVGCGDAAQAPHTYVGDVEGTDIRVGVVTEGGQVAMFFCGGNTSYTQSTKWFRGAADPTALSFAADGWVAKGGADGDTASGTVDRGNGNPLHWTAHKVSEEGLPGLYQLKDDNGNAGVIVIDEKTVQGALIPKNPAVAVQQIEAILPASRQANGVTVKVVESAMPRQFVVTRVHAK
jgi:hypothetical protein